jgi:hypothetical protein
MSEDIINLLITMTSRRLWDNRMPATHTNVQSTDSLDSGREDGGKLRPDRQLVPPPSTMFPQVRVSA